VLSVYFEIEDVEAGGQFSQFDLGDGAFGAEPDASGEVAQLEAVEVLCSGDGEGVAGRIWRKPDSSCPCGFIGAENHFQVVGIAGEELVAAVAVALVVILPAEAHGVEVVVGSRHRGELGGIVYAHGVGVGAVGNIYVEAGAVACPLSGVHELEVFDANELGLVAFIQGAGNEDGRCQAVAGGDHPEGVGRDLGQAVELGDDALNDDFIAFLYGVAEVVAAEERDAAGAVYEDKLDVVVVLEVYTVYDALELAAYADGIGHARGIYGGYGGDVIGGVGARAGDGDVYGGGIAGGDAVVADFVSEAVVSAEIRVGGVGKDSVEGIGYAAVGGHAEGDNGRGRAIGQEVVVQYIDINGVVDVCGGIVICGDDVLGRHEGVGADGYRCGGGGIGRLAIEGIGAAEVPVGQYKGGAIGAGAIYAIGPGVEVLPGLAGAVGVDVAEDVNDLAIHKELDGVIAIDIDRAVVGIGEVGREAEESHEGGRVGCEVEVVACGGGDCGEGKLLAIGALAVVGRADAIDAEVADVVEHVKFYAFGLAAAERAVEDSGEDEIGRCRSGLHDDGARHAEACVRVALVVVGARRVESVGKGPGSRSCIAAEEAFGIVGKGRLGTVYVVGAAGVLPFYGFACLYGEHIRGEGEIADVYGVILCIQLKAEEQQESQTERKVLFHL